MAIYNLAEKPATFLFAVSALFLILCGHEIRSVTAKEDCDDRAVMLTRVQTVSLTCGASLIGKLPSESCCSVLKSIDFVCLCSAPGLNDSTYAFLRETFWLTWPLATTICGGDSVPPASCLAGNTPSTSTAAPGSPVADSSKTNKPPANTSAANGSSASPATPESPPSNSSKTTEPSDSHTPSDKSGCSATLMGLFPCRDYVEGNSYTPSSSCCSQLSNVVKSQPQCLCLLLNGDASSSGININRTLALALPGACNVQTPPVSECNSANGPSPSAASPESPPPNSPKTTTPSSSNAPSAANGPYVSPLTPESPSTVSSNTTKPPSSNTPTVGSDCTTTLMGLSPCLDYVSGNSSTPSSSCCSELSNVVQSRPQCLCLLVNGATSSYGININQTLALGLPGVCNVQTPHATKCGSAIVPSASPAKSESAPIDSTNTTKSSGSDNPPAANGPSASPAKPEGAPISSNTTKSSGSDTPSAQSDCTKTLMGLSPCLNYVTGNSSSPSAPCCSQLSNVVKSQPRCLCLLLNGSASSYGINVNQTLALGLPGACNVETPPMSRCNSANGPSASPAAPGSSTDSSTSSNPSVRIGPSENGASIGGSNIVAVFLVFISSYALSIPGF